MPERAAVINDFLASAGWLDADRCPFAGDLSSRNYIRLTRGHDSCVLMDAPASVVPFAEMTQWLRREGFAAPEILAAIPEKGLMLLQDFGDLSLNALLAKSPDYTDEADSLCIQLLTALRHATPPSGLHSPDAQTMVDWTTLADEYYPGVDTQGLKPFRSKLSMVLENALSQPRTISLRDFHADNVMWLPEREGIEKLGLLDYQDAFLTHPAYDLVSYLTDARVSISRDRRDAVLKAYLEASDDESSDFTQAFSALSAQRNLRILGIFARGARTGKPHHLDKLKRVHGYFCQALEHPVFASVRATTLAALPDPDTARDALA